LPARDRGRIAKPLKPKRGIDFVKQLDPYRESQTPGEVFMVLFRRAGLVGLAFAVAVFFKAEPAHAADPKYLPSDAEIILSVNFRQILDSEMVKGQKDAVPKLKAMMENSPGMDRDAQKYLKAAGFEPVRDLKNFTLAMPAGKDPQTTALVIIEGSFDAAKFHAALQQAAKDHVDSVKISEAGNIKIVQVSQPDGKSAYLALAAENVLFASPSEARLKTALSQASGATTNKLKKEVQSLMAGANGKQSVHFLMTGTALDQAITNIPAQNPAAFKAVFGTIKGINGAVIVGRDVQLQIGIGTTDAQSARAMAQQANTFIFMGKGMAQKKAQEDAKFQPLANIADTLSAASDGTQMVLRARITLQDIQQLMKLVPQNQ
jgi:hypothetical protein